jgi:hypothetical protein
MNNQAKWLGKTCAILIFEGRVLGSMRGGGGCGIFIKKGIKFFYAKGYKLYTLMQLFTYEKRTILK